MKVKMILPALTEAESPFWRPIKYSLFPPLGLATLAGHFSEEDEIELQDQHIEKLNLDDEPDLVVIQVYITNAYRAYKIADHYRKKGAHVVLGGLHVTSLPDEAMNKIAQKELQFNIDIVETPERRIKVSKDIIPYIVKDRTSKDTERGGARDAKRNIKNIVIQKLATYLADEPEEVPVILRLDGVARFRDTTVADPLSADVILVECYSRKQINSLLAQLSTKVNKPLVNVGLFIPKDTSPQRFVQEIVELVKQGYTKFKTEERDTYNQTEFVTVGVK